MFILLKPRTPCPFWWSGSLIPRRPSNRSLHTSPLLEATMVISELQGSEVPTSTSSLSPEGPLPANQPGGKGQSLSGQQEGPSPPTAWPAAHRVRVAEGAQSQGGRLSPSRLSAGVKGLWGWQGPHAQGKGWFGKKPAPSSDPGSRQGGSVTVLHSLA